MKQIKKYIFILCIVIIFILGIYFLFTHKQHNQSEINTLKETNQRDNNAVASPDFSLEEILTRAIYDEYKARATYQATINTFGEIKPFSNIVQAESQHISALEKLFVTYHLAIPSDIFMGNITLKNTVSEICGDGVQGEIENVTLYRNELIPAVSQYPDVVHVFNNLMTASENNHLPAFKKCIKK